MKLYVVHRIDNGSSNGYYGTYYSYEEASCKRDELKESNISIKEYDIELNGVKSIWVLIGYDSGDCFFFKDIYKSRRNAEKSKRNENEEIFLDKIK